MLVLAFVRCGRLHVHLTSACCLCICRYTSSQLVEVNAHSLFSKWFSESGKLVSKLFAAITELVEEPQSLVFVLIDEVESLTAARKVSASPVVQVYAVRHAAGYQLIM